MFQDVNILAELFTSTEMWSLLGPGIMVTVCFLLGKKSAGLGVIWWIISSIMAITFYIPLAQANAYFSWHILILIFGGFMAVMVSNLRT